jgi:AraC-like DNA-binding protein
MRRATPTLDAAARATTCADPTFSVRLSMPFLRVLERAGHLSPKDIARLTPGDLEERVPISSALEMLDAAVALSGDPDLGLRAALDAEAGEYDLLEYLATSSSSIAESVPLLARYARLLNDALDVSLEQVGELAILRFESRVPLNRAAADFQLASFYRGFAPEFGDNPSEVWLAHGAPADRKLSERAFAPAALRFSAPYDAIVFEAALLGHRGRKADRKLHELLRRLADERLRELPAAEPLTQQVRERLAAELAGGDPSAEHIATELHMSRRTLVRRLEQEGTCFKVVLDDLRSGLARRYLALDRMGVSEVAALLGFSDTAAFTRAFRRWSNQSPSEYRRAHRRASD